MADASAPRRLLLIDDDEAFLDLMRRRLERGGYAVAKAKSWADAIPHMGEPFDLCLLDLHLVSLGGDRLCAILKKHYPRMKVVLFSSEDPDKLAKIARGAGADGALSKTLEREPLLAALQAFLRA